jgi:hypothetical protein
MASKALPESFTLSPLLIVLQPHWPFYVSLNLKFFLQPLLDSILS